VVELAPIEVAGHAFVVTDASKPLASRCISRRLMEGVGELLLVQDIWRTTAD
jgi:hypothetical protein